MATGESTEAHSDYFRFERMASQGMYTCWIPLGPCSISKGPLAVCEGSHKLDYSNVLAGTELPIGFRSVVHASRWLTYNFEPGDICIFDIRAVHGSLK
mmetsp:Transcript_19979/g.37048  ORF Transcript_19979/g.37048 Transcript_19979/m.37048 type:complete len:98 (+) Transcript_19979:1048-1341(+)